MFFYPFDFTFVCPTEIIAFSDRVEVLVWILILNRNLERLDVR